MNTKKAAKIINKNNSVLSEDPRELFLKEKEFLNQSFFFEGTNNKAILLIHGWTTTPYELRRLGRYLNEFGYTVSAPLLRGHGSVPKELEKANWTDWLVDIEKEFEILKNKYSKVFVGGTSIGSNLALILAKSHPEISGLILMAAPYKVKLESLSFICAKILRKIKPFHKKHYPPTFGAVNTITRLISYQTYPIKSALEIFQLVREAREIIPDIKQPCFLIQSSSDHVVAKNSLEEIYNRIGSEIKKKKYIKRAYHTFISDIKNEGVFEEILGFLNEN
jgi:carboxylesterase